MGRIYNNEPTQYFKMKTDHGIGLADILTQDVKKDKCHCLLVIPSLQSSNKLIWHYSFINNILISLLATLPLTRV